MNLYESDIIRWIFPVLLLIALSELFILHRRKYKIDWRQSGNSVFIAIGQRVMNMVSGSLFVGLFFWVWEHRLWTVPMPSWWGIALLFLLQEFCYYWEHRLSHEWRWFWASHSVHHSPEQLNLSAAYRLSWTAGFTGQTLFFLPMVALGFHPLAVFGVVAVNLLYQFWLHTELVPSLGWFDGIFNSPSNHRVHHASNVNYLDANYGGVLIIFDRLFGTWIKESVSEPCKFGLVKPLNSTNPFVILFHEWVALGRDLVAARSWRERGAYLINPPGWRPGGQGSTTRELRQAQRQKNSTMGVSP
jgi:sterol desaturase/sphingolipid hydroxylase (fatty acid hydroxylase superfamily)